LIGSALPHIFSINANSTRLRIGSTRSANADFIAELPSELAGFHATSTPRSRISMTAAGMATMADRAHDKRIAFANSSTLNGSSPSTKTE
jgi:hypothetical protein